MQSALCMSVCVGCVEGMWRVFVVTVYYFKCIFCLINCLPRFAKVARNKEVWRGGSQQRLAPNSQYAKPKSKPAREATLFPAPAPPLHYSRCHSENGRPGSHKYGSAALAERCRQTKFINAQDSKLTCSASYAPLPHTPSLFLYSSVLL